jgi:hypothetical protein
MTTFILLALLVGSNFFVFSEFSSRIIQTTYAQDCDGDHECEGTPGDYGGTTSGDDTSGGENGTDVCGFGAVCCVASLGNACTVSNNCGQTNAGNIDCYGICDATIPDDSLCAVCTSGEWVWDSNTCSVDNCVNGQWVNSGECSNFGDGSDPSKWCACDYNCNYLKSGSYSNPNCAPAVAVNGSCASTHYNCASGTLGSYSEYPNSAAPNLYAWQWWCNGSNGGTNEQCTEYKNIPCNLPWGGTIDNGSSVTAYLNSSVAYGSACASETRTCSNGTLSGSYTNQSCSVGTCVSNGSCSAVQPACNQTTYGVDNCGNSCSLVGGTPDNCASTIYTDQTCWNNCEWVNGTLTRPIVCDDCASGTCEGDACWNGCEWVSGTKVCAGECVDYPNPIKNEPTSLCNAGTASSIDENASNWEWTCTLSGGTDSCSAEKDCGDTSYTFVYNENAAELCAEGACGISKDATYVCIKTTENCGSSTVANSFCGTPHPASVACPACPKGSRWKEIAD